MSEQLSLFDYKQLSPELAIEAQIVAERVRLRMRRAAEDIIEIGKDLIEMKAKLPHGSFLPWIKSEFQMTRQTANYFMQVADRFGSEMSNYLTFTPTVLYELASPSTPDSVIEKAIASSENGEKVSVKEVQEWKKRAIAAEKSLLDSRERFKELDQKFLTKVEETVLRERETLTEGYEARIKEETQKIRELLTRLNEKEGAINKERETHQKEIDRIKKNPDPAMKSQLKKMQEDLTDLQIKKEQVDREIRKTKDDLDTLAKEKDDLESNTFALNSLLGAFDVFMQTNHHNFVALYSDRVSPEARDRKRATAALWRDFWIGVLEADTNQRRVEDVVALEVEVNR